MAKEPVVSIIMPAYNAEEYISKSIESVLQQNFEEWELLLIDDASQDRTGEIAEKYALEDPRIKVHQLPANQGAGFARNLGIKASKGRFISFLDSDDLWKPNKLEVQVNWMLQNKVKVAYSSYQLIDENGNPLDRSVQALPRLTFRKLLRANYIGNLTGMYDTQGLGKIYCPLIRKRQDWGLWLLAVEKSGAAMGIKECLAFYRVRPNSISGDKWEMLGYNYQVYRKVLGFSLVRSLFWMMAFLWEQFFIKSQLIRQSE